MSVNRLSIVLDAPQLGLNMSTAQDVRFSTNEHGSERLTLFYPCSPRVAHSIIDDIGTPRIHVDGGGHRAWSGRVEDVEPKDGGVTMQAFGMWRTINDSPYSNLWVDSTLNRFRVISSEELIHRQPEKWQITFDDKINIFLKKNANYEFQKDFAGVVWQPVDKSSRKIARLSFQYVIKMPPGFVVRCVTQDFLDQNWVILWSLTTTGTLQTNIVTLNVPEANRRNSIYFDAYNNNSPSYTFTGEDGSALIRFRNIRVQSSTAPIITPWRIILGMLYENAFPSLSQNDLQISENFLSLSNEIYEDEKKSDILNKLASLGDDQARQWEVGVDTWDRLYYRPHGTDSREWTIYSPVDSLRRTLKNSANSAYAVYKNKNGFLSRTSTVTNQRALDALGVSRTVAVSVDTNNEIQAEYVRDVKLSQLIEPRTLGSISVDRVYGPHGEVVPGWLVKAGDYVSLGGLPAARSGVSESLRRFRIASTDYDVDTGVLLIEPDSPVDFFDGAEARRAAGIKRPGDSGPIIYPSDPPRMGRIFDDIIDKPRMGRIFDENTKTFGQSEGKYRP